MTVLVEFIKYNTKMIKPRLYSIFFISRLYVNGFPDTNALSTVVFDIMCFQKHSCGFLLENTKKEACRNDSVFWNVVLLKNTGL